MSDLQSATPSELEGLRVALMGFRCEEHSGDGAAAVSDCRCGPRSRLSVFFQHAAGLVAEGLEADFGGVAQVVDQGAALNLTIVSGLPEVPVSPAGLRVANRPKESLAAYVLDIDEPVVTAKLEGEHRFHDSVLRHLGVMSALMVPVHLSGEPRRALGVYSRRERDFTPQDAQRVAAARDLLAMLVRQLRGGEATPVGAVADRRSGRDQRTSARFGFRHHQMIAPIVQGRMPYAKDFVEVECRDISAGGFSFYCQRPPDFRTLVVRLGHGGDLSYVSAHVVRLEELERDGQKVCLVGCRFLDRVTL